MTTSPETDPELERLHALAKAREGELRTAIYRDMPPMPRFDPDEFARTGWNKEAAWMLEASRRLAAWTNVDPTWNAHCAAIRMHQEQRPAANPPLGDSEIPAMIDEGLEDENLEPVTTGLLKDIRRNIRDVDDRFDDLIAAMKEGNDTIQRNQVAVGDHIRRATYEVIGVGWIIALMFLWSQHADSVRNWFG
jgi:hypothetical protein